MGANQISAFSSVPSRPLALALVALIPAISASAAYGQVTPAPAPSQVTPRTVIPQSPPPRAGQLPILPRVRAPEGAETLHVSIADIEVDNGFPELAEKTRDLTEPFRSRRVSVADLYALAAEIEAAYARAGFVLVRVNPAPQELADGGTAHLLVTDGFIEASDVGAIPAHLRGPVAAALAPLVGRHHLTRATLERRVLLAGRVAGAQLTTTLARGSQPGGVRLVANAQYDGVSGQLSFDNRLGSAFGRHELNLQVALASQFGLGEQIYGFLSVDPDPDLTFARRSPRRVGLVGLSLPLGHNGLQLNGEATLSRTYPRVAGALFSTRGTFNRIALRLRAPVVLTRAYALDASLSIDATDEKQDAWQFGITLTHDRLRVARFTLDGSARVGAAGLRGQIELSQGIAGLGARGLVDAVASGTGFSRAGVVPDFSKALVSLSATAPGPAGLQFSAIFRAQQMLHGAAPSSELFALDGDDSLSSFDSGATGLDSGWTARLQVAQPFQIAKGRLALMPYLYGAIGHGTLRANNPAEFTGASDMGAGFSLTEQGGRQGLHPFVRMEFGRHDPTGPLAADTRFSIATGVTF